MYRDKPIRRREGARSRFREGRRVSCHLARNGDGASNIQEFVLLINIILGDDLARGESISHVVLEYGNGQFKIQTDGSVAGIELHLSGVYSLTKTYLPDGWEFHSKDHTMLMFNMGGDNLSSELLFEYQGEIGRASCRERV